MLRRITSLILVGAASMGLLIGATMAQAAAANSAEFAVPVETMKLGGAKAKLFETGSAAAGRSMIFSTTKSSSQVFGKTKVKLKSKFRFMKDPEEIILLGQCVIRTEGRSMFGIDFTKNKLQAYACSIDSQEPEKYAMEVALPAFAETRIGGLFSLSISEDINDPEIQAILRGKILYNGIEYEALPTGFNTKLAFSRRVVEGFNITKDGKIIGQISFRLKGSTSVKDQGDLTIPVADSDGREAVTFIAMMLNAMPDMYSDVQRTELSQ
jgi:hypothetical protein